MFPTFLRSAKSKQLGSNSNRAISRQTGSYRRMASQLLPWGGRGVSRMFFFFFPVGFFAFEPSRLCRHPSIRTLWLSDFRSVQVGRTYFSRCCYLITDLCSHLFDVEFEPTFGVVNRDVFVKVSKPYVQSTITN